MISLIQNKLPQVRNLCLRHGATRLDVFGSAAKGVFRQGKSDLDFMVELLPQPPEGRANAYFGLANDLESLFECKVDLLERSAVKNPYLLQSFENAHETVYGAS